MPSSHCVGKAGHLAATGELFLRGYNGAIPEIDKGDDVFVVRHETGAMWRLQVRTSQGTANANARRYQFHIRNTAMHKLQNPELHFKFVVRKGKKTWRYRVMDSAVLRNCVANQNMGSGGPEYHQLYITVAGTGDQTSATCSGINLTNHLQDWVTWPELD